MVIGFATSLVLSRRLGVRGFGEFNYLFAFYYFFLAISDLGVTTVVVREASQQRGRAGELIGAMLGFKMALAAMSMIAAWTIIFAFGFPQPLLHALLAFALILPLTALQFPMVVFQVLLRPGYGAAIGVTGRLVGFLLMLAILAVGGGLGWLVLCLLLSEALVALLVWRYATRLVPVTVCIDRGTWFRIVRLSLPLGVAAICVALINRIDFVMLERMTDLRQVGLYAAAYKVSNLLESFPLILMGSIYPLMSRYAAEDPRRLERVYSRTLWLLGAVAVPLGLGITFMAPFIVRLLFGAAFAESAAILAVLVWATVFLYPAVTGGNLLISLQRERISAWLLLAGAALNIGLNLVLIPRHGPLGAAIATAASFFTILVGTLVAARRALRQRLDVAVLRCGV